MMTAAPVKFSDHTVTKTSEPGLMRIEVEKTRMARRIGQECGLFAVPDVVEFNEDSGVAVFEHLRGIQPVALALSGSEEYAVLAGQLGAALAIIHRDLHLSGDMVIPLPEPYGLSGDEVFLHGDLSLDNVCLGSGRPPVVILDWQLTPLLGGRATYGTRYFDIMWFVLNLLYRPTVRHFISSSMASVARRFVEVYFEDSQLEYRPAEIRSYAGTFFDAVLPVISRKSTLRARLKTRLCLPRCNYLKNEFMELLSVVEAG